jgi:tetratricopeptide (TPR) repeat protein
MSFRSAVTAAALCAAAVALPTSAAFAQSAAEHVAAGDRESAAMNAAAALKHYQAAIAADSNDYDALCKAAREAVDLGEAQTDKARRSQLYQEAEQYARHAVRVKPNDAEGHFHLARALGRNALSLGVRDRIKYATEVRNQALEALKYDPHHAGALHIMGVWNAEVMRLSGFERMMAKNFLGGQVFGQANWGNAVRYMEQSVAADPQGIVHHLDLGKIYLDVGDKAKARQQFEEVARLPASMPNDAMYKRDAERQLAKTS